MKISGYEEEDEAAPESMFEDEDINPPPSTPASSVHTNSLFDPFAPRDASAAVTPPPASIATAIPLDELYNSNHGTNNNTQDAVMVDRFEDEVEPEGRPSKKKSSRSIEDGPVLIPMNPDADADLLGSIAHKHASKAKKDSKIKDITYNQDDDDLLMLDSVPKDKKTEEDDNFVDEAPRSGGSQGLFSRIRNKIAAAATPTKADGKPPKPEAEADPSKTTSAGLEEGGNSLPHPDSVRLGHTRDLLEDTDSDDEPVLDTNGNSLPHPDEMVRLGGAAAAKSTEDQNLNANGNSLPHPDEKIRLSGAAGRAFADKNLDANGNSLPHPDHMDLLGGPAGRSTDQDALDANGNSLPHPDALVGLQESMLLNNALEESGSDRSDSNRLRVALAETDSNVSDDDSEDDCYYVTTDDEELENNGKSLAPPSGDLVPSSRWNRFKSPFSARKRDPEKAEDDSDDEESSFNDEEKMAPSSDRDLLDLVNNEELAFDENGNPLPFERNSNEEKKRKFTLHSLTNALRPSKARGQEDKNVRPNALFADADEENIFGNDVVNDDLSNRDDDDFDDETEKDRLSSMSKKERLQKMIREHKNNPRSRIICIAILAFVLFLVILIPLVTRNKNKEVVIAPANPPEEVATVPPTFPPTETEVVYDPDCVDEIFLTDMTGKDLEIAEWKTPCFLNLEPIYFRFKRCRPAHAQDWVGVYPAGSMFMDRLWKDWYDGVYLCGDQPCAGVEPPEEKFTMAPPIPRPGNYRLFLIKDSSWPYEFVKYTPSFQVVTNKAFCPNTKPPDGIMANPNLNFFENQATAFPTSTMTYSGTTSASWTGTYTSSLFTQTEDPISSFDMAMDNTKPPSSNDFDFFEESEDNILDDIGDGVDNFLEDVGDAVDNTLDNVGDGADNFLEGVNNILDNIDETVDNIFGSEDFFGV